jgi:hypothetical protein
MWEDNGDKKDKQEEARCILTSPIVANYLLQYISSCQPLCTQHTKCIPSCQLPIAGPGGLAGSSSAPAQGPQINEASF